MQNQPNSNDYDGNASAGGREAAPPQPAGGDQYIFNGNVGPLVNIGRGSITAHQMSGHDLIVNGGVIDNKNQFADLLADLRDMIIKAKDLGELPEKMAHEVVDELETARKLVKEEPKPPRETLIQKLQHVIDIIDNALESLDRSRSPAALLIKAVPFVAMLIRLASQIF